ncbi:MULTISPECIES: cupin-like domain-containing protein [Myxococcaceae]|uniref:cupin-like domain-containing protein n=1 Tax=Myxococcaceae TaxID=31 RepID=UPI00188F0914|nr:MULTISPECIES: cupin-like domain-containing protein [Myxococcaceae]MBF5042078.1 cupin-like domain-containing protein [Simulacricoccus sp. 17bor-14]
MKIMSVRHNLADHPLLQLPPLIELAKRLSATNSVRFHNDQASAATSFVNAPDTHKVEGRPEDILASIESSRAWMALHNVQKDPVYRALVDEVLDAVRPVVEAKDPGMSFRAGWIFVASPGAVTPYHMDHEHNFILQIRGTKLLHVWDPLDRSVVTERSLELFHGQGSRELVTYQDAFAPRARVFELEPGLGGYMPTTAPHWVKNGPGVSITASFTYYSASTRRRKRLHEANHRLRSLGLDPRPVQADGRAREQLKAAAYGAYVGAKDLAKRVLGRPREDRLAPYAS